MFVLALSANFVRGVVGVGGGSGGSGGFGGGGEGCTYVMHGRSRTIMVGGGGSVLMPCMAVVM